MPVTNRRFPPARDPQPRARLDQPLTSLLWPEAAAAKSAEAPAWEADIGLGEIAAALALNARYVPHVRSALTTLVTDPAVIGWRQAVLADFMHRPALAQGILALLPKLAGLGQGSALLGKSQRNILLETADRLAELEVYISVTRDLHTLLVETQPQAAALCRLRDDLARVIAQPNYRALEAELPELRAPLQQIRSLTIGLNLDVELKPESAVLLAINAHQFGDRYSWLERVIGGRSDLADETGIAALHRVPDDRDSRPLSPLFQDLDRLLAQTAAPVAKALTKYTGSAAASLKHLEFELAFFAGAVRLFERLRASGIACCIPEAAPLEERVIEIEGLVSAALALRDKPVPSAADFGPAGRIAILTGPNSGGKTTYLRSVGLAVALFQAGLMVPGQRARISPVDVIYTHFPTLESRFHGRLADEALRLRDILRAATRHSLVLLNETFSSTAAAEAVYLAQELLAALRAIGARVVYATHLSELAGQIEEIEKLADGDCRLFSLVAGVVVNEAGESAPTYQIMRGLPHGRSYARDIARKHGISLEQILAERT